MDNMENKLIFRFATPKDIPLVLNFIKELAEYEKMSADVVATEELLHEWIFKKQIAEVIIESYENKDIGFALFFHNFSTFLGRGGIYLEDLYIKPEYRGKGFGKSIFIKLAQIAAERKCKRIEWSCLNWNKPSIDFYLSIGAKPMSEWTVYRLTDENILKLASK